MKLSLNCAQRQRVAGIKHQSIIWKRREKIKIEKYNLKRKTVRIFYESEYVKSFI